MAGIAAYSTLRATSTFSGTYSPFLVLFHHDSTHWPQYALQNNVIAMNLVQQVPRLRRAEDYSSMKFFVAVIGTLICFMVKNIIVGMFFRLTPDHYCLTAIC